MSEHLDQTIAEFAEDVRRMDAELAETKRMVNKLCTKEAMHESRPRPDLSRRG